MSATTNKLGPWNAAYVLQRAVSCRGPAVRGARASHTHHKETTQ